MDSHSRGPFVSGSFHSPACHVGASYDVIHFSIFLKSLLSLLNIASVLCFCFLFFWSQGMWDLGPPAQLVKNLPAMRETWVWSLGREDPLEKEKATHPSILAWRIPWTEEPGRLQCVGQHRVGRDWATNTFTFTLCGILTPCPEAEPAPLALEGEGLSPGPPGKAPLLYFDSPLSAASPLEHRLHEAESFSGHARGMQGLSSRTRDRTHAS